MDATRKGSDFPLPTFLFREKSEQKGFPLHPSLKVRTDEVIPRADTSLNKIKQLKMSLLTLHKLKLDHEFQKYTQISIELDKSYSPNIFVEFILNFFFLNS